jgi:hypothetical protein
MLRWPARWLVPLFIALLALTALGVRYVAQVQGAALEVSTQQSGLLRERLSSEQARLDRVDGEANPLLQRRLVSSLALYDHLSLAYLVDANGRVQASLSRREVGMGLPAALALQAARHPQAGALQTRPQGTAIRVHQPQGSTALVGVVPLKNAQTLRAGRP